jgi:hypothetical protein
MLTERDILGAVAGGHDLDQTLVEQLMTAADYELLRAAVLTELPDLQRAVHPSPGWRRR